MAKILIGRSLNATTDSVAVAGMASALVSESHDWVGIVYNGLGKIDTITYRRGGAIGAVVATLALAYSAGRLSSVAKT